jgi:putative redox protein
MKTATHIQASIGHETYPTKISARGHVLTADEPVESGGKDLGPTPTELLLSSLASCTASTVRMYANRKGWELDRVNIQMSISAGYHEDGPYSRINSQIEFEGNLDAKQRARLLEIAGKCPIHRVLTRPIEINTLPVL